MGKRNISRRRGFAVAGVALLVIVQMAVLACVSTSPTTVTSVSSGVWGGDQARLTVSEASATIEFACAHGTINVPITVDSDGRFDASGTFVRERGGPSSGAEDPQAAQYVGTIKDKTMTLTVTSSQPLGTFTLVLGQTTKLVRCL